MKMEELNGQRVKLSKGTITVKNDDGKTCGMIRGLQRFSDMPFRDQCTHKRAIAPFWGNRVGLELNRLYYDGKTWYYIFTSGYVPPYEMDRYNSKLAILDQAQENGVQVIQVKSI